MVDWSDGRGVAFVCRREVCDGVKPCRSRHASSVPNPGPLFRRFLPELPRCVKSSASCHERPPAATSRARHGFAEALTEALRLWRRGDHGSAVQQLATTNVENVSQDHLRHEHL
jgi:hypothetical protein